MLNLGAMELIVTSLYRWTVAPKVHVWVSIHISHGSQNNKKFPRPTNQNFHFCGEFLEKSNFSRVGIDFDGVLFLADFGQKWQKFVKWAKQSWNETFARTNYQLRQKFVIWNIHRLTFFVMDVISLLTRVKLKQGTCICLRAKPSDVYR